MILLWGHEPTSREDVAQCVRHYLKILSLQDGVNIKLTYNLTRNKTRVKYEHNMDIEYWW